MKSTEHSEPDDFALRNLLADIKLKAEKFGFEVRLLGGLLKFTPYGVHSCIFLELEQLEATNKIAIYKHRNGELTSKYKGRVVSEEWVLHFIEANSSLTNSRIEFYKNNPPQSDSNYFYSKGRPQAVVSGRLWCNACGKPINFCVCARL